MTIINPTNFTIFVFFVLLIFGLKESDPFILTLAKGACIGAAILNLYNALIPQ